MNLPFILDIGIGLFSIYLTLSLLASELQELLTTLFQWRAQHLKQAIETLLAGESKPKLNQTAADIQLIQSQLDRARELADSLYNHSLIRSLDHESKGLLGSIAERASQWTKASKTFSGKASGPSYLPSETFATTLLETLRTGELIQTLSEQKLAKCTHKKLVQPISDAINDLRHSKTNEGLLEHELQAFQTEVTEIVQTFSNQQTTLSSSFNQVSGAVKRLRTASEAILPEADYLSQVCLKRLTAIEEELPGLLQEMEPGIVEVMSELTNMVWVAQSLQTSKGDDQTAIAQLPDRVLQTRFQAGYELLQTMKQVVKSSQEQEDFQTLLTKVPPNLCNSLNMLAKRAQLKLGALEQGANQLQQEVALWFDRSMDRSAGVYKRNAKGVAILIGLLIAVTTNTDTLHIINRLAQDSALRTAYSQAASTLISSNPNAIACLQGLQDKPAQVTCLSSGATILRDAFNSTTALPIGWSTTNGVEQWQLQPQGIFISGLNVLAGWLVSAIAISMGAPFWFNLLNKVINVRNSGKPPASTSQPPAS